MAVTYDTIAVTATSPSTASTAAATTQFDNLKRYDWITIDAALQGAAGGTLDVYLQRDVDGTWVDWIHFTQLAASASAIRYTIDPRMASQSVVTVGSGTTPVIGANVITCAHPGDSVRILFVAGVSTSAGAAQTIVMNGHQFRD